MRVNKNDCILLSSSDLFEDQFYSWQQHPEFRLRTVPEHNTSTDLEVSRLT